MLHIGLPKTGSTSIQATMSRRREELRDKGVLYPKSPGDPAHLLLPASVIIDETLFRNFSERIWEGSAKASRLERFRKEFDAEIRSAPAHVRAVILSSEHCGGFLKTAAEIKRLASFLRTYFDRWRVIVYLRRQDLMMASAWNEQLRGGMSREPGLPTRTFSNVWTYNFHPFLDAWAGAFGEGAIVVRIFEPNSLVDGNVVADFVSACGIDLGVELEDLNLKRNQSLSYVGQRLMMSASKRILERRGKKGLQGTDWIRIGNAMFAAPAGRGWLPTRAEAQRFMTQFVEGNEAVRKRFLPDRPTLFTENFDALPKEPMEADPSALATGLLDVFLHEVETGARNRSALLLRFGRLQRQVGDQTGAKASFRDAVWFDPRSTAARMELAREFRRAGDRASAEEQLRRAVEIDPDLEEAEDLLDQLSNDPSSPSTRSGPESEAAENDDAAQPAR
jgi:hypothetical protein